MTIRNSYAVVLPAVFAACCVSYSSVSCAQPNPQEESVQSVASLYRTEEWPKGLIRDGFPLGSLELKGWQGGQLRSDSGRVRRKFTSTAKTEKPPTVVIEMFVADSVASAQRNLSVRLAERQSAKPAPRAQDRDLNVGDVGYLGISGSPGNPIASVEFVLGNIDVYIGNTDVRSHPELDLVPSLK